MPKKRAYLKKMLVVSLHVLAYLDVEWYELQDHPIIVQEVYKDLHFFLISFIGSSTGTIRNKYHESPQK